MITKKTDFKKEDSSDVSSLSDLINSAMEINVLCNGTGQQSYENRFAGWTVKTPDSLKLNNMCLNSTQR